jgi:mannonate dehydratase
MQRREFLSLTGASAVGAALGGQSVQVAARPNEVSGPPRKVRMHLGTQRGPTNRQLLQYVKRHGVDHICGYPPISGRGYWLVGDLERARARCEEEGVSLDMVALPFLTSSHIDKERRGSILLGKEPGRSRDIEAIQKMIVACAEAGVPAFKYNMSLLGVPRTKRTPGRGGSTYSTWKLAESKPATPLTRAGAVSEELFWERITYFLERIIPVCNENKIRAACHPHDPGVPPTGYQGVPRVLGTPEGLKRFVAIEESPYHGLNLCLGTTAEMLQDPAREIHDVIRYFGTRKKIFNIHFRNIRGRRDDFQEVYPDEGDMNMFEVLRTLQEVDYSYMVMPDHVPHHADDPGGLQAFAFSFGYIKALLQAL